MALVKIIEGVTMREETEPEISLELLRASELRYRRLFETAKDGILILDARQAR